MRTITILGGLNTVTLRQACWLRIHILVQDIQGPTPAGAAHPAVTTQRHQYPGSMADLLVLIGRSPKTVIEPG